jgi:hypothetical protein
LQHVAQRVIPLILLLLSYVAFGRLREYNRLRHFGGPSTTGFSWWWHSRAVLSGRSYEYYGQVCEKYGMCRILKLPRPRPASDGLNSDMPCRTHSSGCPEPPRYIRPGILGQDQCSEIAVSTRAMVLPCCSLRAGKRQCLHRLR